MALNIHCTIHAQEDMFLNKVISSHILMVIHMKNLFREGAPQEQVGAVEADEATACGLSELQKQ